MPVRQLPTSLINQIAAGEVIERPASAVKEIVENAIDAGAANIEVVTAGGGLSLIRVTDDGHGMGADDLALCVERHATSKLAGGDLFNIATLGFRGEALPSIGAAGKLSIASRPRGGEGLEIRVEAGRKNALRPAALNAGTRVEVRDLFYATPARLKFMKSERAENAAIADTVKRLALAQPSIAWSLTTGERASLNLPAASPGDEEGVRRRLSLIMGQDFAKDACPLRAEREEITLTGFAGLPTLNRADGSLQYLFVNGRPVKDRLLIGALRAAYGDLLPRGRHPLIALFISLPPRLVDVNVHPAKAEVRFRDGGLVRGFIIGALRQVLGSAARRTSSGLSAQALRFLRPFQPDRSAGDRVEAADGFCETAQPPLEGLAAASGDIRAAPTPVDGEALDQPLGAARAQLHENYIIAQTRDGVVIVDQHAAHERLVYEGMKAALAADGVARQGLLIPEIVELSPEDAALLADYAEELGRLGLGIERFGPGAVAVRETPALFGDGDIKGLMRDLAAELRDGGKAFSLVERLHAICAAMACRRSVRAGRRLKPEEMDALLRAMEAMPNSGQCNHGRPAYIELKLADIEKLFSRR